MKWQGESVADTNSEIIRQILHRSSEPALSGPAPSGQELEQCLSCALRAPDHALLHPWRYLVIEGEGREALGRAWQQAVLNEDPQASDALLAKAKRLPLRAPMLIVGITVYQEHPKVPLREQTVSTGVGMGYLLLALESLGYGGMWRTGAMAYHPVIRAALKIAEHESITGILYVGTPSARKGPTPVPALDKHVQHWPLP
ncbi:MAG: nitroreductase [Halomonadaceae bacterium]|nr:MAG: nitroreductase [Halomonadaceae bacterium]